MSPAKLSLPALSSLRPYRSFLFLKLSGAGDAHDRVVGLRNSIADFIEDLSGASEVVKSPRSKEGDLYSAFVVYKRERRAPWTNNPQIVDIECHLLLVSGYKTWFAVFMSDAGLRQAVKS